MTPNSPEAVAFATGQNEMREADRAVVAVWDAPIEDDGAALGARIDGLRDALAGRGEG